MVRMAYPNFKKPATFEISPISWVRISIMNLLLTLIRTIVFCVYCKTHNFVILKVFGIIILN